MTAKTLALEVDEPQSELERFAHAVAADLNEREGVPGTMAFDPMTIALIMSVLIEMVKLYLWCNRPPADALKSIKNPNWWERMRLSLKIRSGLRKPRYRHLAGVRKSIDESFLRAGKQLDEEKVSAMFGEANF